ncbi:MAG: fimbrillin family protein [Bacteroides sp.]|nr:fimbrillin family protein [Bacteroides sp.]
MKYLNKSIYAFALVGMAGLWSCSQEDVLQGGDVTASGHPVPVTLTVNRGDAQTRTVLSENTATGGLNDVWEEGDKLAVFSADARTYYGDLVITEGWGEGTGVFSGVLENVENGTDDYFLWYYSRKEGSKFSTRTSSNRYYIDVDFKNQNFSSVEGLSNMDLLSKKVKLNVNDNKATVVEDYTMESKLAMVRFTLEGIDGASGVLNLYNEKASDKGVILTGSYDPRYENAKKNSFAPSKNILGNTPLSTTVESGKDVYMAFMPATYQFKLEFVASDGTVYNYTFENETELEAGLYYNTFTPGENNEAGNITGVKVPLVKDGAEGKPVNPGNMDNWGGTGIDPLATNIGVTKVSDTNGWTNNIRSAYGYGGFATYIRYEHNGMINGYLTSKGGSSIYYQWGRWLGFPSSCAALRLYDTGSYSGDYKYNSQLPLGVDYNNTSIGYTFANHLSAAHGYVYMGSSSWTRERVLRSSIMFGAVDSGYAHGDYIGANEECSWEDRCGNPAPDGYRIPTADELSAFIPSVGTISDTYAEVKTINGVKYAMRWTVTKETSSSVANVEIRSFQTTASTVSKTDAKFDSAPAVKLLAYGYLNNKAVQSGYGSIGFYWSSTSEKLDDGTSNGAVALVIYFNGTSAEFELGSIWRGFGGLVPLIKDDNAKSDTLTPWFPLTGI